MAGIVHALTLIAIILFFAPYASFIPLCALAAILFVVAWKMSELHRFIYLARRAPKSDVVILLLTFALTVFADLVIAVNVGVVLAALLFMRRMARSVEVQEDTAHRQQEAEGVGMALPPGTLVYSIDGPFFFGAAEKLEQTLEAIQSRMQVVVLRMDRVPFVDATGIQTLIEVVEDFQRDKSRVVLVGLRESVRAKLDRAGLIARLGAQMAHAAKLSGAARPRLLNLFGYTGAASLAPTFRRGDRRPRPRGRRKRRYAASVPSINRRGPAPSLLRAASSGEE